MSDWTAADRKRLESLRDEYRASSGLNHVRAGGDELRYELLYRALAYIEELERALGEAANDLGKAANQFEGLRLAGRPPEHDGAIFAAKEAKARAYLENLRQRETDDE